MATSGAGAERAEHREIRASRSMMQVTEWELQRILLDIHDGPVQHMYAALSQLDLLRRGLEPSPDAVERARERIERIRLLLESGLAEVRSFIGAFRPPEFERRDLMTLLEDLVLQHEAATDTAVTLDTGGPLPAAALPVKIALYRVLQEGLSNAYRHGGANRVIVHLEPTERQGRPNVQMRIEDNGAGFDPHAIPVEKHYGLKGMRDRIEMIGGCFSLDSTPGEGTVVTLEVPAE